MKTCRIITLLALAWSGTCATFGIAGATAPATAPEDRALTPLAVEYVRVQGLRRAVRVYRPPVLASPPTVLLALHGSGGDGERLRQLTGAAFERVADEHGFLVAYLDGLGGHWNGCRAKAPYHAALSGIDDLAFLRAVVRHVAASAGEEPGEVFIVGYSNGGHLSFRAALEAPRDFTAFATIGASLPVDGERDCVASGIPVSIVMVSGTGDPINPWAGGEVRPPGGGALGHVLSAEDTARYFRELAGASGAATAEHLPDRDPSDGTRVATYGWNRRGHEVLLVAVDGGGHTLPGPRASFPLDLVGRTSRDLDGARLIWSFFARRFPLDTAISESAISSTAIR